MDGMPLTAEHIYHRDETLHGRPDAFGPPKVPTGIADLDAIVAGGFPAGSTVLLKGDIGAGMQEYVYTAASKLAIVREQPHMRQYFLGPACDASVLPEKICYVTFSRPREVILREVAASFNPEFAAAFAARTEFRDFSAAYFRHSVVPSAWTHAEGPFGAGSEDLLGSLVEYLDGNAGNAFVAIDSLTDLVAAEAVPLKDLVTTVKGLQRAAKGWGGIVYLLLTRGILEERYERSIVDSVDGCLVFEWRTFANSSMRQRSIYVEKFTQVLPHLNRDKIARFPAIVTSQQGLVIVYTERVV